MRLSTHALLQQAQRDGYAVPAFNIVDDLSLRAVVAAAESARSPVIIQSSTKTARSIGVDLLTTMLKAATETSSVPIALHLDHCPDRDVIEKVVAAGWSSLLFDASDRDFETAVRETTEVVALAHANGVEVESEIENIIGVEDGVGSDTVAHAYTVEQLVEAGNASGIDMLAPQLGTAHGRYVGRPNLLPERVRELRALTDTPIVLHGGTGLTDAEFRAFIEAGVSKINISTALKEAYMTSTHEFLLSAQEKDKWEPSMLFNHVHEKIVAGVRKFFEVFGSAGRVDTPSEKAR